MIDWWGRHHEYYAGTEYNGITMINSQEWLEHKGSVVATFCTLHILDDDGIFPNGEVGEYILEEKLQQLSNITMMKKRPEVP